MRLQKAHKEQQETERLLLQFQELSIAISSSRCGTHNNEFIRAYDIGEKYLGRDAVVKEKNEILEFLTDIEIRTLDGEDVEEFIGIEDHSAQILDDLDEYYAKHGNYNEYGIVFHGKKPELSLALDVMRTLTARQITKKADVVSPELKEELNKRVNLFNHVSRQFDQHMIDRILTTYADGKITNKKIKQALTPFSKL